MDTKNQNEYEWNRFVTNAGELVLIDTTKPDGTPMSDEEIKKMLSARRKLINEMFEEDDEDEGDDKGSKD